jgi:hypothetical protein
MLHQWKHLLHPMQRECALDSLTSGVLATLHSHSLTCTTTRFVALLCFSLSLSFVPTFCNSHALQCHAHIARSTHLRIRADRAEAEVLELRKNLAGAASGLWASLINTSMGTGAQFLHTLGGGRSAPGYSSSAAGTLLPPTQLAQPSSAGAFPAAPSCYRFPLSPREHAALLTFSSALSTIAHAAVEESRARLYIPGEGFGVEGQEQPLGEQEPPTPVTDPRGGGEESRKVSMDDTVRLGESSVSEGRARKESGEVPVVVGGGGALRLLSTAPPPPAPMPLPCLPLP